MNRRKNRDETLLFDIDGVILNFGSKFIEFLNSQLNTNYTYNDITDWNFAKALNIKEETKRLLLYKFYGSHHIGRLSYYPGVKDFIDTNYKYYNIILVTALPTNYKDIKFKRVQNLKDISYDEIIFDSDKSKIVDDYEPKYVFEDSSKNIIKIAENSKGNFEKIFVFQQPWNVKFKERFESLGNVEYFTSYNNIEV